MFIQLPQQRVSDPHHLGAPKTFTEPQHDLSWNGPKAHLLWAQMPLTDQAALMFSVLDKSPNSILAEISQENHGQTSTSTGRWGWKPHNAAEV